MTDFTFDLDLNDQIAAVMGDDFSDVSDIKPVMHPLVTFFETAFKDADDYFAFWQAADRAGVDIAEAIAKRTGLTSGQVQAMSIELQDSLAYEALGDILFDSADLY